MCFRKRFLTRFWVIFKVFGINVEFVIRQPMANCKGQYLVGVILVIHLRNIFNSVNTFLMCI